MKSLRICHYHESESKYSASESSDSDESSLLLAHHHLPPPHPLPHCHLPRSLLLALMQVDALGVREQVVCGGQGNNNHPPAPSHVLLVTGGT